MECMQEGYLASLIGIWVLILAGFILICILCSKAEKRCQNAELTRLKRPHEREQQEKAAREEFIKSIYRTMTANKFAAQCKTDCKPKKSPPLRLSVGCYAEEGQRFIKYDA